MKNKSNTVPYCLKTINVIMGSSQSNLDITHKIGKLSFRKICKNGKCVEKICQNGECVELKEDLELKNGYIYRHGRKVVSFHDVFDQEDEEYMRVDEMDEEYTEGDVNVSLPFFEVREKNGRVHVKMPGFNVDAKM